jgi:hypothetical protein
VTRTGSHCDWTEDQSRLIAASRGFPPGIVVNLAGTEGAPGLARPDLTACDCLVSLFPWQ